jgi:hypothetical protein
VFVARILGYGQHREDRARSNSSCHQRWTIMLGLGTHSLVACQPDQMITTLSIHRTNRLPACYSIPGSTPSTVLNQNNFGRREAWVGEGWQGVLHDPSRGGRGAALAPAPCSLITSEKLDDAFAPMAITIFARFLCQSCKSLNTGGAARAIINEALVRALFYRRGFPATSLSISARAGSAAYNWSCN